MTKKITLLLIIGFSLPCFAGNWSLGGGAIVAPNPYRSMKTNIIPIPFISYQGRYFALYGPIARFRYRVNDNNMVGGVIRLGMQNFEPNDASLQSMKQLNERKRLLFLGPYHRFRSEYGQITTSLAYDVTGRSKGGTLLDFTYGYIFKNQNKSLFFRPQIGVGYRNRAFARHYYQVSAQESARSGLARFRGRSFWQPFVGLFAGIHLGKRVYWTNIARVNYMPNRIYNSPMVSQRRYNYSLITGLTYEIGDVKSRFNH